MDPIVLPVAFFNRLGDYPKNQGVTKSGADNGGNGALSGTCIRRCQAEKGEGWFRIWALSEPRIALTTNSLWERAA